MRLPSPDAFLISLFERAFAGPQRWGVPLPALLVATEYGPAAAAALSALASAALVTWWLSAAWAAAAVGFATYARDSADELHAHARGWNESLVRHYRAEAATTRTMLGPLRGVYLMCALGAGTGAAMTSAGSGTSPFLALTLAMMSLQMASYLAMVLARCVMPAEPDARSLDRGPVPASAHAP